MSSWKVKRNGWCASRDPRNGNDDGVADCCIDEDCSCEDQATADAAFLPQISRGNKDCGGTISAMNGNGKCESAPAENGIRRGGGGGGAGGGRQPYGERKRPKKGCCAKIEAYLEHLGKGTTWLAIIFGQVLSLLLCATGVISVYLADIYKIHIPNAQNFGFYIVSATVFTSILACRPAERNLFPILRTRGWKYAFVALADAEANYLVTKAYQLTTLTSVQLLDCFTIPTVLSLSWLVLRIRYKVPHILGVSVCLLGIGCLVWADIEDGRPLGKGKNRFLGDMLCLSGAFLHGISNVAQEFVVKTFDVVEFLAMIGLFGSFISGAQTLLLEYDAVTSTEWTPSSSPTFPLFLAHGIAQLLFYVITAFVVKWSGATMLNLSLLTADFYSLIAGVYLFRMKVDWLYFLSFVLVMSGVLIFSIKPTILDSHVYKSLTREVTTTLDLEMMASTPNQPQPPSQFPREGQGHGHGQSRSQAEEEINLCVGSGTDHHHHGSVLIGRSSTLLKEVQQQNHQRPMLSDEGCDVVLQTKRNGNSSNNNSK